MKRYILALFFVLTANQCLVWFTFSSVPREVEDYCEYCQLSKLNSNIISHERDESIYIYIYIVMKETNLVTHTYCSQFLHNHTKIDGIDSGEIDQLLNWGPISFVACVPFVSFLLTRRDGLRRVMRLAAVLVALACMIRLIPCLLSEETRKQHWTTRIPLHIAQILNGIAGPVLIAAPSVCSFFPDEYSFVHR